MIIENAKAPFPAAYRHALVEETESKYLYGVVDDQLHKYFPKGKAWYLGLEKAPVVGTELRLYIESLKHFLEWQYKFVLKNDIQGYPNFDVQKMFDIKQEIDSLSKQYIQVEVVSVDTLKIKSTGNRKHIAVHPAGEILVEPVNQKFDWGVCSFPASTLNLKKISITTKKII